MAARRARIGRRYRGRSVEAVHQPEVQRVACQFHGDALSVDLCLPAARGQGDRSRDGRRARRRAHTARHRERGLGDRRLAERQRHRGVRVEVPTGQSSGVSLHPARARVCRCCACRAPRAQPRGGMENRSGTDRLRRLLGRRRGRRHDRDEIRSRQAGRRRSDRTLQLTPRLQRPDLPLVSSWREQARRNTAVPRPGRRAAGLHGRRRR